MHSSVLKRNGRSLSRGAAVLLIAGMAAGCSSQAARFGGSGLDGIFTASTNQRQILAPKNQAFPAEPAVASAPLAGAHSGTVTRSALAPAGAQPQAVAAVAPAAGAAGRDAAPAGTRAGGTELSIREGETVYNLSRRFGVPADVIMQANGMTEAQGLRAGQKIVIPAYADARGAPAAAKSSPAVNAPGEPLRPTGEKMAALGSQPKPKAGAAAPAAADASNAAPKAAASAYSVQEGDTLSRIAKRHGVSTVALKAANRLDDGIIRVGQTLRIPAGGNTQIAAVPATGADPAVTARGGQSEPAAAKEVAAYTPPKRTEKVIQQAEEDGARAPDATGIDRMRWPVRGRVISAYATEGSKRNDGIDIAVPEGTPVKAAENGVVIYAGDGLKDFGNTVLVRHGSGLVTVYGHASELKVSRGDTVKRGQEIAVSGMSGSTEAPKLHFEVRKNSAPVDPVSYLE